MIFELLRWWYGPGWLQAARNVGLWTGNVERAFSAGVLVSTLFAPWRRIISDSGRGLDGKMQAMLDNMVSRMIGFVVRGITLLAAGFSLAGVALLAGGLALCWPFVPLGIVYFVVRSITG